MDRDSLEFDRQQATVISRQYDADWVARNAPAIIANATVYRAREGKKPAFSSSHDAVQYERGFKEFPNQPPGLPDSPRMQGYNDAEQAHALKLQALVEHRDFEVTA
jgi:hypothetical protein